jgi:hypothetical protein
MNEDSYNELLTEKEAAIAYNEGLKAAVYVLERAEKLSPEGRRYLLEELKKQIADNEMAFTARILRWDSSDCV